MIQKKKTRSGSEKTKNLYSAMLILEPYLVKQVTKLYCKLKEYKAI